MKRITSPGLLSPQIGGKGNENNSVGSEPNQSRCRAILIFPAHTKAHYWLHWWHTNFGLRFWREVLEPDNKSILIALRWSANVNVLCSGNVSQTWKLTFQDSPLRPWPEGKDGFFLFCFLNGWLRRGIIYRIQVMLEINKEETYKVIKCTCITSPAPLYVHIISYCCPFQRFLFKVMVGTFCLEASKLSYFPYVNPTPTMFRGNL